MAVLLKFAVMCSSSAPDDCGLELDVSPCSADVGGSAGAQVKRDCEQAGLRPDCQGGPGHSGHRRRRGNPDSQGCGDGPRTLQESFQWASQFWSMLEGMGVATLGENMAENLMSCLSRGLQVSTEYSGMGGPEEALRCIVEAAPRPMDLQQKIRFVRCGDREQHCRQLLLAQRGHACVFDDILS